MEEAAWKKDKTPYIIFACSKCRQFTYVKTNQKTKKCARCGRAHTVSNILDTGEIVYGISTAVEVVKQKQDEFAIKELDARPSFRTFNDFTIIQNIEFKRKGIEQENEKEYEQKFEEMLIELSKMHDSFPFYILEIMADNYGIPVSEVKLLTRSFIKKGILKRLKDYYYQVKLD